MRHGWNKGREIEQVYGVKSVGICLDDDENDEDDDGEYIILIQGNFWCDEQ